MLTVVEGDSQENKVFIELILLMDDVNLNQSLLQLWKYCSSTGAPAWREVPTAVFVQLIII